MAKKKAPKKKASPKKPRAKKKQTESVEQIQDVVPSTPSFLDRVKSFFFS